MGATQDPPRPLPLAESVPPLDTDGAQVTDCAAMHSRGMGGGPKPLHHLMEVQSAALRSSVRHTLTHTVVVVHGEASSPHADTEERRLYLHR